MNEYIYIQKTKDYENFSNCKKTIFWFKNKFNIITKKKINNINILVLPFKSIISNKKFKKIIRKQIRKLYINENTKLVLSKSFTNNEIKNILDKYNVKYINENVAKKQLIFKVMDYINRIQKKEQNQREITILANNVTDININLITRFAFESKSVKIVSKQINKFKNLEEKLYNENGIAIQFSNSYKKSLKKSDIIINLDFCETDINEYEINTNAIIINTEDKLKIKTKLFNGIVVNSYNIKFVKTVNKLNEIIKILDEFDNLFIYESIINSDNKYLLNDNNVKVINTIGNNGIILDKEFKNIR